MSDRPLTVCLVGTGRQMAEQLVPAMVGHGLARPVGVVSRDGVRSRRFAARWDVPVHGSDLASVLAASAAEGVVVASDPAHSAVAVAAALRRGLPVFVEKPPAVDLPTTEALAELERDHDGVVLVGFNWAFADRGRRILARAETARLLEVRISSSGPSRPIWGLRSVEESVIASTATHAIDLALRCFGAPLDVQTECTDLGAHLMSLSIVLTFVDGRTARLVIDNAGNGFEIETVLTEEGGRRTRVDRDGTSWTRGGPSSSRREAVVELTRVRARAGEEAGYRAELEHFVQLARDRGPSPSGLGRCRDVMAVADRASRQSTEGRTR